MTRIELISASAGSGKTYRLADALERAVTKENVRPGAILATTFTRKAAAELQERVRTRLLHANRVEDALALAGARIGTVNSVAGALVQELRDIGPVLESLANAGPALTRSLSFLATFPWPNETLENWWRGDFANVSVVVDLTLSRIDAGLFTGSRWEGNLTELEMQWGRTIGQMPSPYTAGNPLIVPYHRDEGS